VARWGEKSKRSRGYGLSNRPPDVPLDACAPRLVFEDPRSDRARMRKAHANTTLLTFDAVFPDTYRSVGPVDRSPGLPLLGFVQRSPLRRSHLRSPLPERPRGPSFGRSLPRLLHVPSSWFSTTSTACSSTAVRVYCNALPTLGFTPFPDPLRRLPCSTGPSSGCLPCPPKPSLRPQLRRLPSHACANARMETSAPRGNVTGVSPRRSPLPLPPRPFPPSSRPIATVTRACVSSPVR
jgi:hypothetical protein